MPKDNDNPLSVTISTPKAEVQQLEPVVVDLRVENVDPKGRTLSLPHGHHRYLYRKILATQDIKSPRAPIVDESIPETRFHQRQSMVAVGGGANGGSFEPSAVTRDRLIANLVSDMSLPGDYTIRVEMHYYEPDTDGRRIPAVAQSNAIKVRVLNGVKADN